MSQKSTDKLTCQEVRQTWHDQIDGLADAGSIAVLQSHLVGCDECRRYCSQMHAVVGALDDLRLASEEVAPAATGKRLPRAPYLRLAKAAAAVLIVVGAGLLFLAMLRSSERPPAYVGLPEPAASTGQVAEAGPHAKPAAEVRVELIGESAETMLCVQRDTGHPRVHLFMLYPLVQPVPPDEDSESHRKPI